MSLFSTALRIHEAIYKGTDGLVGHKLLGVPTLLLRTTGAKSKLERTNALVYAEDGGRYLVVASKGGADTAPAWLHNLRANRDVGVQIGRRRKPATATVIDPSDPDYAASGSSSTTTTAAATTPTRRRPLGRSQSWP